MSNVIQFSITGDTNAEQVVNRTKTAVSGLDAQISKMGRGFANGFSSIFLSFLGPMALLGAAMAFIGKMISDNQKKHEDANKAAIEGTNALMSAEDKYYANKLNKEKQLREQTEEAKTQRKTTTKDFLENDPRRDQVVDKMTFNQMGAERLSARKYIQDKVQAILAPEAVAAGAAAGPVGNAFKSPEGFSNVIGVGANPVLENMTRQTDIQQQILEYIKAQVPNVGRLDVPDFTKRVPLTLQKSGLT